MGFFEGEREGVELELEKVEETVVLEPAPQGGLAGESCLDAVD